MSQSTKIKFRPSLTLAEITQLAQLSAPVNPKLSNKLQTFILKAQHGITRPSHVTTTPQSISSALGFSDAPEDDIDMLLELWDSPSRSALSQSQLARVAHHRYTHDMMSPQEEQDYENN